MKRSATEVVRVVREERPKHVHTLGAVLDNVMLSLYDSRHEGICECVHKYMATLRGKVTAIRCQREQCP